jgi:hypothetical protein
MNPLITNHKSPIPVLLSSQSALFLVALASVVLLPRVQAVVPAPDGGYPGGNTAEGQNALFSLTSGGYNTAVGYFSLRGDATGSFNTAVGAGALLGNTGDQNTALGLAAGLNLTTGQANICIGSGVTGVAGDNNTIRIGDNLGITGGAAHCYIGGIYSQVAVNGVPVYVNENHKLGVGISSRRFKEHIKPMDNASTAILALKPVTFYYTKDAKKTPCFGLIAEDVAKVNPDLVVRDEEGKPFAVRYEHVNAMLLNEFLKEHKTVQELKSNAAKQEAIIAQQQKQIEALTAGLKKVSAQLEASKPAPQVVNNP